MRFWDSSALVPLVMREEASDRLRELWRKDEGPITWWGSLVECASALARLERSGELRPAAATAALRDLDHFAARWNEIEPAEPVRETARRLLRVHTLAAGDAFQLAAAVAAAEGRPASLSFVCLDERLALAAEREGFQVVG